MFSCKFCEISKNIFLYRTSPVAASKLSKLNGIETIFRVKNKIHKLPRSPICFNWLWINISKFNMLGVSSKAIKASCHFVDFLVNFEEF